MFSNLHTMDRFWWVFLILAIVSLCILEGILGNAVDRQAAKLNPKTRRRIAWGIFIGALALAAFLLI